MAMAIADDHLGLYLRGLAAADYARSRGGPGMEFDAFGRELGRALYLAGLRYGLPYLLTPVNIVRYWEFPFTAKWVPAGRGCSRCSWQSGRGGRRSRCSPPTRGTGSRPAESRGRWG